MQWGTVVDVCVYLSQVGWEGFLSFLQGFDLAGGERLEVGLLSLQPGPLGTDLPERRLFFWPPSLADRHLHNHTKVHIIQGDEFVKYLMQFLLKM